MVYALGLEAIRQAALKRLGMAWSHKLVLGGTTLLLRALRGKQVTKTGRAADQLSRSGNFEALGDGLFGLLHGESGRKQSVHRPKARAIFAKLIRDERGFDQSKDLNISRSAPNRMKQKYPKPKKAVDKAHHVLSVLTSHFSVS